MKFSFIEVLSFTRYSSIGIISTLTNYLIFIFFLHVLGFGVTPALIMGYLTGCLISFHFGRTWIFGVRNSFKFTQLLKFLISYAIGCFLLSIISNFVDKYIINSSLKWLISTLPIIAVNYSLLRLWVFENNKQIKDKRWGGISKIEFLQVIASRLISYLNPAVTHNLEKYYAIKKAFYLSCIEDIEGDYLEFGVFEGSSFSHAMRCYLSKKIYMPLKEKKIIRFFGFDSFEGFGQLTEDDKHPFYIDEQFKTSYEFVERKIKTVSNKNSIEAHLIKGFLNETLKNGPQKYNIKKARIIFIDLDLYEPSLEALFFCQNLFQEGTILILDDFFSYKGSLNKGVAKAFENFKNQTKFKFREIVSYGMGGKVFICCEK
ncbi:methyltransferase [Prochlorococcus marinus str. MIT 9321]|uniref:Methyltransferase n=1 Tax=Prochlorococcus marinus str. MIT 9401 TaxID=167551 RepID=A0A0A2BCL7_PROMR|nr:GtrA family protein [Prochlorococcus marinus]KGG02838.1 methyltransferase [Prochlorococcus marinus str. MIT 9321]KGG05461.1 methyltransferase [Prochlorococcus marinus str. MIT 9322]KGG10495.1 methyltransferase [Prochlorococcus marinus str. MIT 9401]